MVVTGAVAAVGLATSVYNNEESKKAQSKHKKGVTGTVRSYRDAQLGNVEQGYGEQERLLKQANREELEGSEEAIQRYEGAGAQAIEDQSARAQGQITAGASARGLMGSSVQGSARLGVGRAASRSYLTLGEAVSGMRQNLAARRAAATNRLGTLRAYKAQARNNVLAQAVQLEAGFQAGLTPVSQNLDLSGLGQAAGYYAGQQKTSTPNFNNGSAYGGAGVQGMQSLQGFSGGIGI